MLCLETFSFVTDIFRAMDYFSFILEPSKPSTTSLPNISRSRQCHHGNGESRWLGNDELDKILFNVDHRPVNYYRCEDPTPETDASASAEWCLSECNIIPPKPQYRNMGVQVSELPDACQVLKFDSDGRSSFGTCGDGNRKTSRHCRRHLFRQESAYNDFYKNKRGEVKSRRCITICEIFMMAGDFHAFLHSSEQSHRCIML